MNQEKPVAPLVNSDGSVVGKVAASSDGSAMIVMVTDPDSQEFIQEGIEFGFIKSFRMIMNVDPTVPGFGKDA